ncbi:MAG: sugar ABC transporter permease [Chloroflexi bacterium]|nr:sugar ABC transporter permease [Chloroflexota bacterium]
MSWLGRGTLVVRPGYFHEFRKVFGRCLLASQSENAGIAAEEQFSPAQSETIRPRFGWLKDRQLATLFLFPTLGLLIFMNVFPLVWSLYLSFTDYRDSKGIEWTDANWIGLENYQKVLTDARIWERFTISGYFVLPAVLVEFVLGFGIALLLNQAFRGRGVITTIILIPMMLSPIVVAFFWRFMFQADIGIVNYFIVEVFNLDPVLWLTKTKEARIALVLVDTWQWTPFIMLISLAGLAAVPKYLYEAADVDRATEWFKFRHITLPMVSPLLIIAVLFRLMDTYKLFDLAWILTKGGGPGHTTQVLPVYLYKRAFTNHYTGEAAATGYIMLVVIIALANLLIRFINQEQAEG